MKKKPPETGFLRWQLVWLGIARQPYVHYLEGLSQK